MTDPRGWQYILAALALITFGMLGSLLAIYGAAMGGA